MSAFQKRKRMNQRPRYFQRKKKIGLVSVMAMVSFSLIFSGGTKAVFAQGEDGMDTNPTAPAEIISLSMDDPLEAETPSEEVDAPLEAETPSEEAASAAEAEAPSEEAASVAEAEAPSEEAASPVEEDPNEGAAQAKGFAEEDEKAAEEPSEGTKTDDALLQEKKAPLQAPAHAPSYQGTVTLVGQWTDESQKRIDTISDSYTNPNDKIGKPVFNGGLLNGLAKVFLGWTDKPLPKDDEGKTLNGKIAEGARWFSPEDKISAAFPGGIKKDSKLYAVYYSLNDPDDPLPGGTAILGLFPSAKEKLTKDINKTKVTINTDVSGENTLPDTRLDHEIKDGENRAIIDQYTKKDDTNTIHELVLHSEFQMDDGIAMLVYRNPIGSNQLLPILSRDYTDRYGDKSDFPLKDGTDAGYSYVDLEVRLDKDIEVPDTLFLKFFGYSWRPLYVMAKDGSGNYKALTIKDPKTSRDLGNTKNSFDPLVNNTDPNVRFGVDLEGNHTLILRTVLRHDDKKNEGNRREKISEVSIKPAEGKTIAETILANMTLEALGRKDLQALFSGASPQDLNKKVLRIEDPKAEELANTGELLKVDGSVRGHAFCSAGTFERRVPFFGTIKIPLAVNTAINNIDSNIVELGYKKVTPLPPGSTPEPKPPVPTEPEKPVPPIYVEKEVAEIPRTKTTPEVREKTPVPCPAPTPRPEISLVQVEAEEAPESPTTGDPVTLLFETCGALATGAGLFAIRRRKKEEDQ